MEEKNKEIMEQPQPIKECNQQLDNNEINMAPVEGEGSINKFKSTKALEDAYTNLEKEFTKKCQKISELERQVADNANAPAKPKEVLEEEFYSNSKYASKYRDKIAEYVSNNDVSLESAYAKILEQEYKSNDELVNDENFINNFVMTNSSIKQKIIGEYLTDLLSKKQSPLITENTGSCINLLPKLKPNSIKEAGDIVQAMFDI